MSPSLAKTQYFLNLITSRVNPSAANSTSPTATSNASLLIRITKLNSAIPHPSAATMPARAR